MAWTRITDQDEAATLLPAWMGRRMVGLRGRFGLLLATGDVLRVTSIGAVLVSSDGMVLLDVSLDHAGVPDGVDLAWETKHFLGAPYPGADEATVNAAHIVAAVEFADAVFAESSVDKEVPTADEVVADLNRLTEAPAAGQTEIQSTD